jgi:hypothetical protein
MVRFWCLCFGLSRFVSLFFCVFCVFVVRELTERRRRGPFCLFSFERGQKTEEEKKKSKKKKVALCEKEKKFKSIALPHSFKEARHVKRYAAHSIRKIRFCFKHKMN